MTKTVFSNYLFIYRRENAVIEKGEDYTYMKYNMAFTTTCNIDAQFS